MLTPYELFVGLRYTRAKRRNHFISFISLISLLGIVLGMTALITVMSVMNGFQKEVRDRMLSAASHIQISGSDNVLADWKKVALESKQNKAVIAAAPYVSGQGLLMNGDVSHPVFIRGILPEQEPGVVDIDKQIKAGALDSLKPGEYGILLGVYLARALHAGVGDKVLLITPQGQVTPAGLVPRLRQFTVGGIFEVGHYEYDAGFGLIHMTDAQKLYRLDDDKVSGVRLKLQDMMKAPEISAELARTLTADAYITDWAKQNANYFRAVQIEKRMLALILALIIAVAAFNIVSAMVMVVTEKQSDIAILRTLGATPASIMKIFMVQGAWIGVIGTVLGLAGGILLALNVDRVVKLVERVFSTRILSPEIYFISDFPSEIQTADVVMVAVVSFAMALLATLYPSYRASRTKPAEALRYE
ncbi:MAG: lipoprotein-releasing ABC transporter permease subunit [Burkholderiales bacterium]